MRIETVRCTGNKALSPGHYLGISCTKKENAKKETNKERYIHKSTRRKVGREK
jgi:hypothetical protein